MNILYVSHFTSERVINNIYQESGKNPGFSMQKFSRLFTKGLIENGIKVSSLSAPPYNRHNTKKKYISTKDEEENGVAFTYVPIVNVPILKNLVVFVYVFFYILKWQRKNQGKKSVIFDVLSVSACLSGMFACRIKGIERVGIVTDMPTLMNSRQKGGWGKVASWFNGKYLYSFDKYVFLTEHMNDAINIKHRPYIIMEGLVDSSMAMVENSIELKSDIPILLYAGGLYKRYGLDTLVEAVKTLNSNHVRLVLYGDGPMVEDLKLEHDRRIEYRGVVPNREIVIAETKATLLVNPRPTHESFTLYSFPSKNMEYMISGTPVLTTCLPGMPTEYHPYVYLFEEESITGYANKIAEVLALGRAELHQKGLQAKQFVLENKNEIRQAERVINLLNGSI